MNTRADGGSVDDETIAVHKTLRFAVGVTAAFVIGQLLQWSPPFVAAVLASALLGNLPMRPSLKVGIVLVVVMAISALTAFVVSSVLRGMPVILFGLVGLGMFLALHGIHTGKPKLPGILMMICLATIPIVMLVLPPYGDLLPRALVHGMAVAMLVIWTVFAIWPAMPPPKAPAPATRSTTPVVTALISAAVILPVLLVYLLFGLTDVFPVLVGVVLLSVDFDPSLGPSNAISRVLANFAGGLLGLFMYYCSHAAPNLFFLGTIVFLTMLLFGWYIAAGRPMAAFAPVACNASLIILGTALLTGAGPLWISVLRVFYFGLAGAFVVGMTSLIWHYVSTHHAVPAPPAAKR